MAIVVAALFLDTWPRAGASLHAAQPATVDATEENVTAARDELLATITRAIDARLVRATSAEELLAGVDFWTLFGQLKADEVCEIAARAGAVATGLDGSEAWREAQRREREIDDLRPAGLLTAFATAPGESLLSCDAPEAYLRMKRFFEGDRARFFAILGTERMWGLLDDRIGTNAKPRPDPLVVFSSAKEVAHPPSGVVVGHPLLATAGAEGTPPNLTLPIEAIEATARMPKGHAYLRSSTMHLVEDERFFAGLVDAVDARGRTERFPGLWMDAWEKIVEERFDAFFRRYKQLGGALDIFSLDVEDKSFAIYELAGQNRIVATRDTTSRSVWESLTADVRWPEMARQLAAAGVAELSGIEQWYSRRDPRAARWNAVMERRRADYLNRAVWDPIRRHFPQARLTNYANYQHTQLVPAGDMFRFQESAFSTGTIVGTHQSYPMYGTTDTVVTPNGSLPPKPQPIVRARRVAIARGQMIVRVDEQIEGVAVGEQAQLRQRTEGELRTKSGQVVDPIRYTDLDLRIVEQPDERTLVLATRLADAPEIDLPDSHLALALHLWRSYPAMLNDLMFLRTMAASSRRPIVPWLEDPFIKRTREGWHEGHPYYAELMFHLALGGADDYLLWVWSKLDPAPGHAEVSRIVAELNRMVGFAPRRPLVDRPIGWDDPYVISGMEVAGKRVWRLTPRPGLPCEIASPNPAEIRVGRETLRWTHGEVVAAGNGVASLGHWIVEHEVDSPLAFPAAELIERLGSIGANDTR